VQSLAYFDERATAGERLGVVRFEQRALDVLQVVRRLQYTSKTPTDRLCLCVVLQIIAIHGQFVVTRSR